MINDGDESGSISVCREVTASRIGYCLTYVFQRHLLLARRTRTRAHFRTVGAYLAFAGTPKAKCLVLRTSQNINIWLNISQNNELFAE